MDINIKALCEKHEADIRDVARVLYPDNLRPDYALYRVTSGIASLSSEQLVKLSHFFGVGLADLYDDKQVKASTKGRFHTFKKGSLNAIYNADTRLLTVYEKNTIVALEEIAEGATVTELFNLINKVYAETRD